MHIFKKKYNVLYTFLFAKDIKKIDLYIYYIYYLILLLINFKNLYNM